MNITIQPTFLKGGITPPPSKSQAHRAVIAAALSHGTSTLDNLTLSQDISATLNCMAALGAQVEQTALTSVTIRGLSLPREDAGLIPFDCGESGSTLRFLIPIALAVAGGGTFTGHGRLMERPQQPYLDLFREKGIFYEQANGVLTVKGHLTPGRYALAGNVSSQFITGLLYALPLLDGDSELVLTTPLESEGYVDMTLETLSQFGVQVHRQADRFVIPGRQVFQSRDLRVECDWSQAAFWYAAQRLGRCLEPQNHGWQAVWPRHR